LPQNGGKTSFHEQLEFTLSPNPAPHSPAPGIQGRINKTPAAAQARSSARSRLPSNLGAVLGRGTVPPSVPQKKTPPLLGAHRVKGF